MCISAGMLESGAYVAQGISDYQTGKQQQRVLNQQGERSIVAANQDAGDVRREGQRIEGANRAAIAASGLSLGSGSSQALAEENARNIQRDVDLTLYRGRVANWEARTQGKMAKYQGRVSLINNSMKAYASLEKSAMQAATAGAGG